MVVFLELEKTQVSILTSFSWMSQEIYLYQNMGKTHELNSSAQQSIPKQENSLSTADKDS